MIAVLAIGIGAAAIWSDDDPSANGATVQAPTPSAGGEPTTLTTTEGSPELQAYAARADEICYSNYRLGVDGERQAERNGVARGWSNHEIEAADRYAWADALGNQHRMLLALGDPPQRAAAMRRWVRTSQIRARLYRRIGDAWLHGTESQVSLRVQKLDRAKAEADTLAEWMPFRVCGTGGGSPTTASVAAQRADPPVQFTAEMSAPAQDLVHTGTKIFWYHRVVGRVTHVVEGRNSIVTRLRIERADARLMIGRRIELYRDRKDPSESWLAIYPHKYESVPTDDTVRIVASGG